MKAPDEETSITAEGDQVQTIPEPLRAGVGDDTREFVLVGDDGADRPAKLESFKLAVNAGDFERRLQRPLAFARDVGAGLGEYLARALSHRAALAEPKDLAWLLASYARDGLSRVEVAGDSPSLRVVRNALEDALGVRFEGDRGTAFFRSTLVQTLFYGVFSAWVLWARQTPTPTGGFTGEKPPGTFERLSCGHSSNSFPTLTFAAPWPSRGPGLEFCRTRPGGPWRVFLALRPR